MNALTSAELAGLVRSAFAPRGDERGLLVLVDLPDAVAPDHAGWAWRRTTAAEWAGKLGGQANALGLPRVTLALYRNVRRPNQELPGEVVVHDPASPLPADADALANRASTALAALFESHSIVLAPTEFSATAPLKLAARQHGFRAATMPGFSPEMIPALRLDWTAIDARCRALKARLDASDEARFVFEAEGMRHGLTLDLRHRSAHASGGLLTEPGIAGNLPSGETYIVPYEGEREGAASRSAGTLPLEIDGEFLVYRIDANRVVGVEGDGPVAARERREIAEEPAYANVAELGLGILADYGIHPIGELLLDEKLGLHIAFGRSDHFGGQVGPKNWRDPARVCHIDRVFIPEVMPRVRVVSVDLVGADGAVSPLMRDGRYV